MRAAIRLAWILAAGGAGLCGCAQLGSSLNLAGGKDAAPKTVAAAAEAPAVAAPAPAAAQAAAPPAAATAAGQPQMLPPVHAVDSRASHETARPPSWGGLLDILAPIRGADAAPEEATPPPPSEFVTAADVQISPAAVPTKDELLAKLKSRPDVDAAEFERWEKIVQSTPDDDWPLVALQLQAVLNYKSFQAAKAQESGVGGQGSGVGGQQDASSGAAEQAPPAAAAGAPAAESAPQPEAPKQEAAQPPPSQETPPQAPAAQEAASGASAASPPAEVAKPAEASSASAPADPASPAASSPGEPPRGEWREHLERAIETLEAELRNTAPDAAAATGAAPPSEEEYRTQAERQRQRAQKEAYLRLLYVAAQRHADAARSIESFPRAEQDFWKHQVHGLGVFLDEQGAPVADRRARLALRELREGLHHLAAASGLDVRNLAFCPQVFSYGNYVEFSPYEFRPNQEVLLYAEIDNFTVEARPDGYETELQGSFQIFDAAGRRVAEHVFPPEKELCRNRRRDYFIPFRMYLPKRIAPGPYTLQLTIEDLKGRKFGQASIRFTIAP